MISFLCIAVSRCNCTRCDSQRECQCKCMWGCNCMCQCGSGSDSSIPIPSSFRNHKAVTHGKSHVQSSTPFVQRCRPNHRDVNGSNSQCQCQHPCPCTHTRTCKGYCVDHCHGHDSVYNHGHLHGYVNNIVKRCWSCNMFILIVRLQSHWWC